MQHRNNIQRYCRLLATPLTDTERQYIHRRIAEENAALAKLDEDIKAAAADKPTIPTPPAMPSVGNHGGNGAPHYPTGLRPKRTPRSFARFLPSEQFQRLMADNGVICSMSRSGAGQRPLSSSLTYITLD